MTNKNLWLGIVHCKQMKVPTSDEILRSPLYTEEVKEALKKCKKQGDVKREIGKLIKKYTEQIMVEQVFLTDSRNKSHLENATMIIDIDSGSVIKNRLGKEREQELVDMYLKRYDHKITQFRQQFGKN